MEDTQDTDRELVVIKIQIRIGGFRRKEWYTGIHEICCQIFYEFAVEPETRLITLRETAVCGSTFS